MPSTLALMLPIASSGAQFGLALFQQPVFNTFLFARPSIAGTPLSSYWTALINRSSSLVVIVGCIFFSGITGAIGAVQLNNAGRASEARLYAFGAAAALGHLLFVPKVAGIIREIGKGIEGIEEQESEDEGVAVERAKREKILAAKNEPLQKKWLRVHAIRTFTVDLAAMVLFFQGFGAVVGWQV